MKKNAPDNDYPFDEVEMTLFDKNGVIKIGNSIYVMQKNKTYEIKDGDLTKINRILSGDFEIDNVIVLGEKTKAPINPCDPCNSDAYDYDWSTHEKEVSGIDYKIKAKWKINNNHPFLLPYFHVETKSYKYRRPWWGGSYKWYSYRTHIEAGFEGNFQMHGLGSIYYNVCCPEHTAYAIYLNERDTGYERSINYFLFSLNESMTVAYFDETFKTIHKQKFTVTRWVGSEE